MIDHLKIRDVPEFKLLYVFKSIEYPGKF